MALFLDASPSAYKSEAIRVVKSTDLNQDFATPVLDVVASPTVFQQLQAVVNTSTDIAAPNGAKVQIWAMAFGTGSTPYLNSWGGPAGVELEAGGGVAMSAGIAHTFGRDWNQTHGLSATDAEVVPLLGANSEFHCCIKANAFAVDANDDVIEGVRLGASPTLDLSDPRQAQRNMTIKTHATGTAMMMLMFAGNTDEEREQPVRLFVKDRPLRRLPRQEIAELEAIAPWIRRSEQQFGAGFVPGLEVVFDDERLPIRFGERPLEDLQLELGDASGPELEIELPPLVPHRMLMQTTLPKDDFVLRSLDVAQVESGEVVGEAHVLLLSVPDELVEKPQPSGYARA